MRQHQELMHLTAPMYPMCVEETLGVQYCVSTECADTWRYKCPRGGIEASALIVRSRARDIVFALLQSRSLG